MSKVCCGFGHRNVFENITERLYEAIHVAIEEDVYIFIQGNGRI